MSLNEYPITLSNPEVLRPEIVETVFSVARKGGVVCLSDIKRESGLRYDVIRAALHFLESRCLIVVMQEEARRFGIKGEQTPVRVTGRARRIGLEEVGRMLYERPGPEAEEFLHTGYGALALLQHE
jgi:hypothetical protein